MGQFKDPLACGFMNITWRRITTSLSLYLSLKNKAGSNSQFWVESKELNTLYHRKNDKVALTMTRQTQAIPIPLQSTVIHLIKLGVQDVCLPSHVDEASLNKDSICHSLSASSSSRSQTAQRVTCFDWQQWFLTGMGNKLAIHVTYLSCYSNSLVALMVQKIMTVKWFYLMFRTKKKKKTFMFCPSNDIWSVF